MVSKQHMEWAAEYIAWKREYDMGDCSLAVTNAFVAFFERWNEQFDERRFRRVAGEPSKGLHQ